MEYNKRTTLKEAGQRLSWRFSQGKPITINLADLDALNLLLTTINQSQTKTIQDNRLFAKLYIVLLQEFAIHYKSVMTAQKQINKILHNNTMEMLCADLVTKLNLLEGQKSLEEKPDNAAEWMEASETWDIDSVIANLDATISQAVNNYKNLD